MELDGVAMGNGPDNTGAKRTTVAMAKTRASYQSNAKTGMHHTQWWLHEIGEMSRPVTPAASSAHLSPR
jgi:hypothetical protein